MLKTRKGATESPLNVFAEFFRVGSAERTDPLFKDISEVRDLSIFSENTPPACLFENPHRLPVGWFSSMATAARKYTSGQIDRAGKVLSSPAATKQESDDAIAVMDSWRVAHNHPLEMARTSLASRVKLVNPKATIGMRLKREESIRGKLLREPTMKLSKMQDIGGCRVILRDMQEVENLVALYANDSGISVTDYVENPGPRVSGYRGKHIIWRFEGEGENYTGYKPMRIEIQVRTELQHSWATAVEVCSTFTSQNLKFDHPSVDDERWVRFFALMGSVMALREGGRLVENTPSEKGRLLAELKSLATGLRVSEMMDRWNTATEIINAAANDPKAHHFLIELQAFDHIRARVNVTAYGRGHEQQAAEDRVQLEKDARTKIGIQVALVAVQSVDTLRVAYPNYFSDTQRFLKELEVALHGTTTQPFIVS
jgi:hypothetical protein